MARWKTSIRVILFLTLVIALVLGAAIELNRRLNNIVLNPYRLQATGDILIDYMNKHNRWPTGWSELQQFTQANGSNLYGVRTFRELYQNVAIDFSFDPESLEITIDDAQEDGGLRVVVGNDGTLHGATRNPNATIYQYLKGKRHQNK